MNGRARNLRTYTCSSVVDGTFGLVVHAFTRRVHAAVSCTRTCKSWWWGSTKVTLARLVAETKWSLWSATQAGAMSSCRGGRRCGQELNAELLSGSHEPELYRALSIQLTTQGKAVPSWSTIDPWCYRAHSVCVYADLMRGQGRMHDPLLDWQVSVIYSLMRIKQVRRRFVSHRGNITDRNRNRLEERTSFPVKI